MQLWRPRSLMPLVSRTTQLRASFSSSLSKTRRVDALHRKVHMALVDIPTSPACVSVSIIDTTSRAYGIHCETFFHPRFKGLTTFDFPSHAFLITHEDGQGKKRRVVFDLGIRKDRENMVPPMVEKYEKSNSRFGRFEVQSDVSEILTKHAIDLDSVEAIVWSHLHLDHLGDPKTFPSSTKLIVGPGLHGEHMWGWPSNPKADFRDADIEGREVVEITREKLNKVVGGMAAFDYFGDGSFYLLDAPGHSRGHLNALAQTSTSPSTFIFMAADSVHLGGEFRPSDKLPLPHASDEAGLAASAPPADEMLDLHPQRSPTSPFLGLDASFPENLPDAEKVIKLIQDFDADDRVFVTFAHDTSLLGVVDFFPYPANAWKEKDWKQKTRWTFLKDLQKVAKSAEEH